MTRPDGITTRYRWGVVSASEPKGVRTIKGYVTVLEEGTPEGAPLAYTLVFFDANGHTKQTFDVEEFAMFSDAAGAALQELGLLTDRINTEIVGEIITLSG